MYSRTGQMSCPHCHKIYQFISDVPVYCFDNCKFLTYTAKGTVRLEIVCSVIQQ